MIAEITREELKQKLDHPRKVVLLETLAAEDYRRSHLPGALNLPPDEVRHSRLASYRVRTRRSSCTVPARMPPIGKCSLGTVPNGLFKSAPLRRR
jgi:hypothetical protein